MEVNLYQLNQDGYLQKLPHGELSPGWPEDEIHRWIDIQDANAEEVAEVLAPLNLHELVIQACSKAQKGLRLAPFEHALFLALPVQSHKVALQQATLSVVCMRTTLITISYGALISIQRLAKALCGHIRLPNPTTSALVYKILDHMVNQTVNHVLKARDMVEELAEKVTRDPDPIDAERILYLKRRVGQVAVTGEDQLYSITNLQTVVTGAFDIQGLREYFRELSGSLDYVMRSLIRLDSRLNDLHQFVTIHVQEKADSRLRFLTIISAIFLPMTLIAGIYGMNFDFIPELHVPGAYFITLGVMAFLGAGMLWYFRRKGWFE